MVDDGKDNLEKKIEQIGTPIVMLTEAISECSHFIVGVGEVLRRWADEKRKK